MRYRRASSSSEVVRLYRPHMGLTLNQILRMIESFPQSLKGVGVIAFALLLDDGVLKSADWRTQTLDRLIPNPERFRQSVFQDFALGIECLPRRWRGDRGRFRWKRGRFESFRA
jgi:hypothetical protein